MKKINYVYSIRINKEQRDMLKKNESIKKELDKIVRNYISHSMISMIENSNDN